MRPRWRISPLGAATGHGAIADEPPPGRATFVFTSGSVAPSAVPIRGPGLRREQLGQKAGVPLRCGDAGLEVPAARRAGSGLRAVIHGHLQPRVSIGCCLDVGAVGHGRLFLGLVVTGRGARALPPLLGAGARPHRRRVIVVAGASAALCWSAVTSEMPFVGSCSVLIRRHEEP